MARMIRAFVLTVLVASVFSAWVVNRELRRRNALYESLSQAYLDSTVLLKNTAEAAHLAEDSAIRYRTEAERLQRQVAALQRAGVVKDVRYASLLDDCTPRETPVFSQGFVAHGRSR